LNFPPLATAARFFALNPRQVETKMRAKHFGRFFELPNFDLRAKRTKLARKFAILLSQDSLLFQK
jgi:hypothetical protein